MKNEEWIMEDGSWRMEAGQARNANTQNTITQRREPQPLTLTLKNTGQANTGQANTRAGNEGKQA